MTTAIMQNVLRSGRTICIFDLPPLATIRDSGSGWQSQPAQLTLTACEDVRTVSEQSPHPTVVHVDVDAHRIIPIGAP